MSTVDARSFIDDLLTARPAGPVAGPRTTETTLELRIQRFLLALLLDKAATVVPTRDVAPVLKNVRVEAHGGRLRLTATDTELSMIATTDLVDIAVDGICCLPAKKMRDILKEAEDGDVHLLVRGTAASVTAGRTTWNLTLVYGNDFPEVSPPVGDTVLTAVAREPFTVALNQVRYAACRDVNRPNLTMIDITGSVMTAADGARFAQTPVQPVGFDCQIPIDAVDDLMKLLRGCDLEEIHVGRTPKGLIFKFGSDLFIVTTLQMEFPDLAALWLRPALANKHPLQVGRQDLLTAVRRVRINADTNTSAIGLTCTPGLVTVTSRDTYSNDATEPVSADWDGPPRTLVVNHAYLVDAVTHHGDEVCRFMLGDDTRDRKSPLLLRDSAGTGAVAVVQQMKLDWSQP